MAMIDRIKRENLEVILRKESTEYGDQDSILPDKFFTFSVTQSSSII